MTTLPNVRLQPSRPMPLLGILAALCMTATACGWANAEPAAEFSAGTATSVEADGPEYGDSLDQWYEATGTEAVTPDSTEFPEIQWEDLVPPGFSGDEIWARFEDRLAALEDGSPEAEIIYEEMQAEFDVAPVNPEHDGKKIQLAGFVAPLTYDGELITEFLLVPYFGACIHVPPPPPNQTVMVTLEEGEGLTFDESWGAIWVTGTLTATSVDTDLATAGYSITGAQSGVHDDY